MGNQPTAAHRPTVKHARPPLPLRATVPPGTAVANADLLHTAVALHDDACADLGRSLDTLRRRIPQLNPLLELTVDDGTDAAGNSRRRVRLYIRGSGPGRIDPDQCVFDMPVALSGGDHRARLRVLECLGYALFRAFERIPVTFNVRALATGMFAVSETSCRDYLALVTSGQPPQIGNPDVHMPCRPVQNPTLHSLFHFVEPYRRRYAAVGLYWLLPLFYACAPSIPDAAWDRLTLVPSSPPPSAPAPDASDVVAVFEDEGDPRTFAFYDLVTAGSACKTKTVVNVRGMEVGFSYKIGEWFARTDTPQHPTNALFWAPDPWGVPLATVAAAVERRPPLAANRILVRVNRICVTADTLAPVAALFRALRTLPAFQDAASLDIRVPAAVAAPAAGVMRSLGFSQQPSIDSGDGDYAWSLPSYNDAYR